MTKIVRRRAAMSVALILIAFGIAGCDKCGNPVKFNAPSLPNSCGADRSEAH